MTGKCGIYVCQKKVCVGGKKGYLSRECAEAKRLFGLRIHQIGKALLCTSIANNDILL